MKPLRRREALQKGVQNIAVTVEAVNAPVGHSRRAGEHLPRAKSFSLATSLHTIPRCAWAYHPPVLAQPRPAQGHHQAARMAKKYDLQRRPATRDEAVRSGAVAELNRQ